MKLIESMIDLKDAKCIVESLNEFFFDIGSWFLVRRSSSKTVVLNSEVVCVHLHVEEAVVAPEGSP